MKFIQRWKKKEIEKFLEIRRVLMLVGARQCGKTTLVKDCMNEDIVYRTLDDDVQLRDAKRDPATFVLHNKRCMIIDEIQKEPRLLMAVKKSVDEDQRPGRFIITGSADVRLLPTVQESLAGRIRKIRLRSLSQGEILGKEPTFFKRAFSQSFKDMDENEIYDRDTLIEIGLRGGFPEVLEDNLARRLLWHDDYVQSLLERDLQSIFKINRQDKMENLFTILAAWSSKFMDLTAIAGTLEIDRQTVNSYINILQKFFVVEKLKNWAKTDYERVSKRPKIFMADSGLMASLLKWRMDMVRLDSDKVGKLFETLIYNELSAQVDLGEGEFSLYHYRDREKREIDFLVEGKDGALLGIEVKASAVSREDDFKHLIWFKNNLAKKNPFIGIVLYAGQRALSYGKGLWAIPISALW